MIVKDITCNRCSRCCYYIYPLTNLLKRCKYLKQMRDGTWYCKKWTKRNSMIKRNWTFVIDKFLNEKINRIQTIICVEQKNSMNDHIGCPYNTNKEMAKWEKEPIQ